MKAFASDTGGATAIEYCMIAMMIGLVIISALTTVGGNLNTIFTRVGPALQ